MEKKVFIDSSAYLSVLNINDSNHSSAVRILEKIRVNRYVYYTSYSVIGEVLTVGSQRYNKSETVKFVSDIIMSPASIFLENIDLMRISFDLFSRIPNKDISWVDCYSFVLIEKYAIDFVFTFDKDFKKYSKANLLRI